MRKKALPFELHASRYDSWYDKHLSLYKSELKAVRLAWSFSGRCIEVGVGTGRFAAELGISFGVDPSPAVLKIAKQRGVKVVAGAGEALPFADSVFDSLLIAITLCFLDDPLQALKEAHRVLKGDGRLVVAFIDADSPWGRFYQEKKKDSPFYRVATFYSFSQVERMLEEAGFKVERVVETLFQPPGRDSYSEEEPVEGRKGGSFVVVVAAKGS